MFGGGMDDFCVAIRSLALSHATGPRSLVASFDHRSPSKHNDRQLAEKRVQEAQEDFARFRREQRRQTPAALQAEVVRLTKERAELEARCERERAEKVQAQLEKVGIDRGGGGLGEGLKGMDRCLSTAHAHGRTYIRASR